MLCQKNSGNLKATVPFVAEKKVDYIYVKIFKYEKKWINIVISFYSLVNVLREMCNQENNIFRNITIQLDESLVNV